MDHHPLEKMCHTADAGYPSGNGLTWTRKSTIAQAFPEIGFVDGMLGASFFCLRDVEDRGNLQATLALSTCLSVPPKGSLVELEQFSILIHITDTADERGLFQVKEFESLDGGGGGGLRRTVIHAGHSGLARLRVLQTYRKPDRKTGPPTKGVEGHNTTDMMYLHIFTKFLQKLDL